MDSNSPRTSSVLSNVDINVRDDKSSCKMNSPLRAISAKNNNGEQKRKVADEDQENKPPENTAGFTFKKPFPKETMPKEDATLNTLIDGINYLKLGGSSEPEKRFNLFKWTTPLKKQQTRANEESPSRADSSIQNQSYSASSSENDKDDKSQSDDANSEYYDCSDEENSTQVDKSSDHLNTTGSSFHSVHEKNEQNETEVVFSNSEIVSEARIAEINRNQRSDDSFMLVKYLENTFSIDDEHFKLELTMSDVSCRDRTLDDKVNDENDLECTLSNVTIDEGTRLSVTPRQSPNSRDTDEEIEQIVQDIVNRSIETVLLLEDEHVESNVSSNDPLSVEQHVADDLVQENKIVQSTTYHFLPEEKCSNKTPEIQFVESNVITHEKTKSNRETPMKNSRKSAIFPVVELVENGSFIKPESLEISFSYINDPFNVSLGTLDNLSPQLIFNSKTIPEQTLDDQIDEVEEIYGGLLGESMKENHSDDIENEREISMFRDVNDAENQEIGEQEENIVSETQDEIFRLEVTQNGEPLDATFDAGISAKLEVFGVIESIDNHFEKPTVVGTDPEDDKVEANESSQQENIRLTDDKIVEPIREPLDATFDANVSVQPEDTCELEIFGVIESIDNHFAKPTVLQTSPEDDEIESNETGHSEETHLTSDKVVEPRQEPLNATFDSNVSAELEDTCELDAFNVTESINDGHFKPILDETCQLENTRLTQPVQESDVVTSTIKASPEPDENCELETTRVIDDVSEPIHEPSSEANDSLEPNDTFQLEATRTLDNSSFEFALRSLDVTSTFNISLEPKVTDQLERTRTLENTDIESGRKSLDVTSTVNVSLEPQLEVARVIDDKVIELIQESNSNTSVSLESEITCEPEITRSVQQKLHEPEQSVHDLSAHSENNTVNSIERNVPLSVNVPDSPEPESVPNLNSTFPITQEDDDMRMEVDDDYPEFGNMDEFQTSAMSIEQDVVTSAINELKSPIEVLHNAIGDKWNTLADLSAPQQEKTVDTTPLNSDDEMDETSPIKISQIVEAYEVKPRYGGCSGLEVIPESNETESQNETHEQSASSSKQTTSDGVTEMDDQQVESESTSLKIESKLNGTTIIENTSVDVETKSDSPEPKNNAFETNHDQFVQVESPSAVTINSNSNTTETIETTNADQNTSTSLTVPTTNEKCPGSCDAKSTDSDSSSSTIEASPSSPAETESNSKVCSPINSASSPKVLGTNSTPISDENPTKNVTDDFSTFKTPNRTKLIIDSSFNADYCAGETPSRSAFKNYSISPRCSFVKDRALYSPFSTPGRKICKGTPKASGDVSTNLLDMSIGFFQQFTTKTASNNTSLSQEHEENRMNRTVDVDEEPPTEETKLLVIEECKMINVKTQTHDTELDEMKAEIESLKSQLVQKDREFQEVLDLAQKVHQNNETLKKTISEYEDNQRKLENKYQLLKDYSNELLARRNEELDQLEIKYEIALKKLNEKSGKSTK